jgi:PAS domain S-box-containing protein
MGLTQAFLDELTNDQLLQRLNLALEGGTLGIWDWDLRDDSVQYDRRWCELLGLDHRATPMTLETWSQRVHPDDHDACLREIAAHVAGTTDRYENVHRMRHANGEWRYILDRGRVSGRDADGRPIRMTGTYLDVTERERARRHHDLEDDATIATLARFAATLSHELNTPLQVISIAADMLEAHLPADAAQPPAVRDSLHSIAEMAARVGAITRALRVLARDGRSDPEESVAVAEILTLTHDLSRSRFESRGMTLEFIDRTGGAHISGRPADLLRALINLVDNAYDAATGPSGWVRVEADRVNGRVVLRCIDNGTGIAAEHVARLGTPFFSTKAPGHGVGVGLSIVRAITERGRGEFAFVDGAPHTTFELRMPVAADRS